VPLAPDGGARVGSFNLFYAPDLTISRTKHTRDTGIMRAAAVTFALLETAHAFQAPALKPATTAVSATMFSEGDIGVTPPLGVWDPLGLIGKRDMRRYEIMEIKHGRAAMLGFLHIILIHAGVRLPGYLSPSQGLKFADMPTDCFASLEATPTAGWLAIMLVTCMTETGASAFAHPPIPHRRASLFVPLTPTSPRANPTSRSVCPLLLAPCGLPFLHADTPVGPSCFPLQSRTRRRRSSRSSAVCTGASRRHSTRLRATSAVRAGSVTMIRR
jgi:hypothetical protein